MLSEAKHLLFLIENSKSRFFATARDDVVGDFFSSLLPTPPTLGLRGSEL